MQLLSTPKSKARCCTEESLGLLYGVLLYVVLWPDNIGWAGIISATNKQKYLSSTLTLLEPERLYHQCELSGAVIRIKGYVNMEYGITDRHLKEDEVHIRQMLLVRLYRHHLANALPYGFLSYCLN